MRHRYRIGDAVHIARPASANAAEAFLDAIRSSSIQDAEEVWEVVGLLPAEGGEYQYRIKGCGDGLERIVRECQLASPG
jgi:hypothetical protein